MRGSKACQQAKMKVLAPMMLHSIASPSMFGSAGGALRNRSEKLLPLLLLLRGGVQLLL
jgi:hypothetical protein